MRLVCRVWALVAIWTVLGFARAGEADTQRSDDQGVRNGASSLRVIPAEHAEQMMVRWFRRVAGEKIARLQTAYPPSGFAAGAEGVRDALRNTYMMPPATGALPRAQLVGTVGVDGVQIEKQLLQMRPGVYTTSWVYKPAKAGSPPAARHPALLMLPGHGDPGWSPAVQSRCLSFARQGYVVMLVEPFGQDERGEAPLFNESHDSQAAAFLMATGQSLLGVIMADHEAELAWLCSRGDVDCDRVGVTGVSMGGTHSLWLTAIERRIRACAADAVAPVASLDWGMRHHGLCDLMVGLYDVAYDEMIRALVAPRAYLEIIPSVQRPVSAEGIRLLDEGRINNEEAIQRHALTEEQVARQHPYAVDVYARLNAADRYRELVVPGPHDYTKSMRELAAGWFGRFLRGAATASPIPEPSLSPITDRKQALATLAFWPDGRRPSDMLTPTAYVEREVARLIGKLPAPPSSRNAWERLKADLRRRVGQSLRTPLVFAKDGGRKVGDCRIGDSMVSKLIVTSEEGIELPMLLFAPAASSKPSGMLHVMLDPGGMARTAESPERKERIARGEWVLCVDLRGMGETRYPRESGGYLGIHDYDLCVAALKLGGTQAGLWTKDLLAAIEAARAAIPQKVKVVVSGERETGLVAILAAGQSTGIDGVETTGLLASYQCAEGYGLPYAYSGKDNDKSVTGRSLGGYGSMIPCIPGILAHGDIAQLAALVAPRGLTICKPLGANGKPVQRGELDRVFGWTRQAYRMEGAEGNLRW